MVRVGFGRGPAPAGALPVYSVDTEEEADRLLIMTCKRDLEGVLYAPELAAEQTLENLLAFSEKLERAHQLLERGGHCRCASGG